MPYKTNRRKFLGSLSLATAATAIGVSTAKAESTATLQETEHAFAAPPYLQSLNPDSVHVLCMTTKNAFTWVEYGDGDLSKKASLHQDGFIQAYTTLTDIPLTGLQPGTRYSYQVVSKEIVSFEPYKLVYGKEIRSETYHFTTPSVSDDKLSWLILNDIHDRPASFGVLLNVNGGKPFDTVFLNGDMFDYQTDEQQMLDHLILPCTQLFASEIPFILSRGNHETRGKYARHIKQYFNYPGQTYYHTLRRGPVFWVILDTGEDKPDDEPVYADIVDFDAYREEQAQWVDQVMSSDAYKEAPFKVVLMHIPLFHSGDWHGTMHCRELFDPLFRKHKVDMVISGHTHVFGVHGPSDEHPYPVIIGGGPKEGNRTIIQVSATNTSFNLRMKRDDGTEVGKYDISK